MLTWATILLAAGTLAVLAVVMAVVLGWANDAFHVQVDPRIDDVANALPGANCGGCGFIGCQPYAEAVVNAGAPVDKCTVGGAGVAAALAAIMGVEVGETWPRRAVVHCSSSTGLRKRYADYYGEMTCAAAHLIAGVQGCVYGCLGFGDCADACAFDAIHVRDGVATVDYAACTGCGACVRACPREIVSVIPFKTPQMLVIACSNRDFGTDVKDVCDIGCIGCKLCAKASPLISMQGDMPVIDYDAYAVESSFEDALGKCRPGRLVFVGPGARQQAEESPAMAEVS